MIGQHSGHSAAVGSLAAEAGLLLEAMSVRLAAAQAGRSDVDGPAEPTPPIPPACPECGHVPAGANDAAGCTGCPICRLLTVLRGERPEVTGALVDAAALVVTALRGLLPPPAAGDPAGRPPAGAPEESAPSASGSGGSVGVQRIRIQ